MRTIKETLKAYGTLLEGHFLLTSGKHSNQYVEKAEISKHPFVTKDLCWEIAQEVVNQFKMFAKNRIEVVVGLAPIGAVLANRVAEHLEEIYQEKVISIFVEKNKQEKLVFKRSYHKDIPGKKILIVDDVLTTGGSVAQVKKEVEKLEGEVMAVAVICKRGEVRSADLQKTPILALCEITMKDWEPSDCPLCKEGLPLVDPKSR